MNDTIAQRDFVRTFPTHQPWQKDGPTVSFSEVFTWLECAFKHKLAYVDRLSVFEENVHSVFGTVAHLVAESFLLTKHEDPAKRTAAMLTSDEAEEAIRTTWAQKDLGSPVEWVDVIRRFMSELPGFMDTAFGDWAALDAEERLLEAVNTHPVSFKGYVDGVIVARSVSGKRTYWLIDWKFTNFWSREKKSDARVRLQLVLYKHFWALKHGIPLRDIRCAFVLVMKKAKPGRTFELMPVSAGDVTLGRGLKTLKNMLTSVDRGLAPKNRTSCKYCQFHETEHCP